LLQVYALPFSDPSENLPGVYNYLINCANVHAKPIQFPKQYGQWKEGCFLHEPLDGHLQQNRASKGLASSFNHVYFKVIILHKLFIVYVDVDVTTVDCFHEVSETLTQGLLHGKETYPVLAF